MGIYIRIDVDKPYGHKNYFFKILSKINEDFFTLRYKKHYLKGLKLLLKWLNQEKISTNIYFRNCTLPNQEILNLVKEGNHSIGFHAENTRSKETFSAEFCEFRENLGRDIKHFTKHGSGRLKLGKHHYPDYEPEEYKKWAEEMNLVYRFGNGTLKSDSTFSDDFIPDMFWAESWYRHHDFSSLEKLIDMSKEKEMVFILHPANYETHSHVRKSLVDLVRRIKEESMNVKTIS